MKAVSVPTWVLDILRNAVLLDSKGGGSTRFIRDVIEWKEVRGEYCANMTAYEILGCIDKPLSHNEMILLYATYGWVKRQYVM